MSASPSWRPPSDWTAAAVRELREHVLGYTGSQMADALGLGSKTRVSEIENGGRISGQVRLILSHIERGGDIVDRRTEAG